MKNLLKTSMLATAIAVAGSVAQAATLLPGGTSSVKGTTAAADPQLPGTVVNDDILSSFVRIPDPTSLFGVGFDIQNRVVESSTAGTLNFGPRIRFGANITGGNFLIDSLQLFGYGDFETDVAYRTDGLGDRGPTFAERSADGDVLSFDFGFPIFVGNLMQSVKEESYFLSIKTNATHFENTGRASIFGRHMDYPGQTFQLEYTGLAVPLWHRFLCQQVFCFCWAVLARCLVYAGSLRTRPAPDIGWPAAAGHPSIFRSIEGRSA